MQTRADGKRFTAHGNVMAEPAQSPVPARGSQPARAPFTAAKRIPVRLPAGPIRGYPCPAGRFRLRPIAGCETTDGSPVSAVQAQALAEAPAPKAEPPMTHARAAQIGWAKTERGPLRMNLDKRADVVTQCIADTLQAAHAPPQARPKT